MELWLLLIYAIVVNRTANARIEVNRYGASGKCSAVIGGNIRGARSLVLLFLDNNNNNNKVATKLEQSTDSLLEELIDKQLVIPKYVIQLTAQGVSKFNGIYNYVYDDFITFEESKLYLLKLHENPKNFTVVLSNLQRIYFWRNRDKVIVKVNNETDIISYMEILKNEKIPNVIFLYGDDCENYVAFEKDYHVVNNKTNNAKVNLFGRLTLMNLMGRKIRVSLFDHVRDAHKSKTTKGRYDGRDAWMAKSFMNFVNATPVYFAPTDGIDYGENRNGTFITGVFGDVAYNRTDVALNSRLMKPEFQNHVEHTYPHDRDDLVILVPCTKNSAKFQYYKAFTGKVWITLIVLCLCFLLIFVVDKTFGEAISAGLYTFGIFLGQNVPHIRTASSGYGPFWVFLYHFYGFLIMLHYSALLYSIITVPEDPHEIDSFDDLVRSDLKIYTLERYRRYIRRYGSGKMEPLKPRIHVAGERELVRLIDDHGNYAIISKKSVADYTVINRRNYYNGNPIHRIMEQSPFPALVCYITQYGSALKPILNDYIMRIVESGIQEYWMRYNLYQIYLEENKFYLFDSTHDYNAIYLSEIYLVFILYIGGCLISLIAFFIESYLGRIV